MQITFEELRELVSRPSTPSHSFVIGEQYLIRTVTHYYTGRIAAVTDSDIVLEDAAWIADTGRFSDCLRKASINECEPFPEAAYVTRGCIVDFTKWSGKLPSEQK